MQRQNWETVATGTAGSAIYAGDTAYRRLKRAIDILLATTLLLIGAPGLLLIALTIKLTSRGPVLFRQTRVGRHGRLFVMYKFRSMRAGSSPNTHREHVQRLIQENTSPGAIGAPSLKLQGDTRITAIGRFIRATGFDELPQFFNVLRGDMSIVGPRPPLQYEYEVYNPWHKQRLEVLPGITGLWQVSAHNQVSFDEMVAIDIGYIASMSLWLDLKIMLQTPYEMLFAKGSG